MDGLFFYWLFWAGWIVITFLYPKYDHDRLKIAAWILSCILLSNYTVHLGLLELSLTGLFMIVSIYVYVSRLQIGQLLYFLLTSFIIMLATASFLLFEVFDPVWVIVERKWLLAILLASVTLLLQHDKKYRICTLLFGLLHGEILFAVILSQYSFSYSIATLNLLDSLALALVSLIAWNAFEYMTASLAKIFHSEEKEKQKLI